MKQFEENEMKIAKYLDGKLSAGEEEAFMRELGENPDLCNQYEDELLIRGLLNKDEATFRNAETPDNTGEKDDFIKGEERGRTRLLKLEPVYRNVAAIAIVVIATVLFFFIWRGDNLNSPAGVAEKPVQLPVVPKMDSSAPQPQAQPQQIAAGNIFKTHYAPYSSATDPVEISKFYTSYQKGDYGSVISGKESDYQVMGAGERNDLLKQYMHLYKGLSFLGASKPDNAIKEFNIVLQSAAKDEAQYYTAQWYLALAYLEINDVTNSTAVASQIALSHSPYKSKAQSLLDDLKGK